MSDQGHSGPEPLGYFGLSPIEEQLMVAVSHLSNAQEIADPDEDVELIERINEAKVIIIEQMEKLRPERHHDTT